MIETQSKTVGFGGGFADSRNYTAMRRSAPLVQVRTSQGAYMGAETQDARPKRQLRTGAPNCRQQLTEDSIARMPRWKRWGLYALLALTMSGVLPMLACGLLEMLCDAVGWWVLIPLYIVVGRVVWRVMWE